MILFEAEESHDDEQGRRAQAMTAACRAAVAAQPKEPKP
jgi:hypothetical protein